MTRKILRILFVMAVLAAVSPMGWALPRQLVGTAYDIGTGEKVFTMTTEFIRDISGHVATNITYKDPSGKIFAREELDFRKDRIAPDYKFHNIRTDRISGAEVIQDRIAVYEAAKGEVLNKTILDVPNKVVISAGIDYFIKDNWKTLIEGKSLRFDQVVPTEVNFFSFSLKKIGEPIVENKKYFDFKMQVQNFLYRMLVDPIVFRYDSETKEIVSFEGMFHLTDPKGNRYKVKTIFAEAEEEPEVESVEPEPASTPLDDKADTIPPETTPET